MHYLKFSIKRQVVYEKAPPAGAQKNYTIYTKHSSLWGERNYQWNWPSAVRIFWLKEIRSSLFEDLGPFLIIFVSQFYKIVAGTFPAPTIIHEWLIVVIGKNCCLWSSINGGKGNRCMYLCSGGSYCTAEQSEQLRKLTVCSRTLLMS